MSNGRVVLVFLFVAASCGEPADPTSSVAAVEVAPSAVMLFVGASEQLTATARDPAGNPLGGKVVAWQTSNEAVALVDHAGLVTGMGPGTATVTASSEGRAGTATVTVVAPAVASVDVTPATVDLAVGMSEQLTATVRDSGANPLSGRQVAWQSSDVMVVSVDGVGKVTGVGSGTATVTASSEGCTGTATVTVTDPAGQILFGEGFDDDNLAGRGWYDGVGGATVTTSESRSGAGSLEIHWAVGTTAPHYAVRRLFAETDRVYVSYWVKYSANYVGSGRSYHPHEFGITTNLDGAYSVPTMSYLYAAIEQVYRNGGIPQLAIQDNRMIDISRVGVDLTGVTEQRSVAGCNGNTDGTGSTICYQVSDTQWYNAKYWSTGQVGFQPDPGPGYKGDWNHVEAYFQLNTIADGVGQADGIVQYWLNGNLLIEHTTTLLRTGANPTLRFDQFLITPYIGDGSPVDQYMWVDDLVVATAR